jgi:hypothetical protein
VPESDKAELAGVTDALKEALKDQDADAATLTAATEAVMTVFGRIGQAMYQNVQPDAANAAGGGDGEQTTSTDDDEVVEGEIVEEGGAS